MSEPSPLNRSAFLNLAGVCEAGLLMLAMAIGWMTGINPVNELHLNPRSALLGLLATLPLVAFFFAAYRTEWKPLRHVRELLMEMLRPLLTDCRWYDIVLLALMAGVCEEILFRGTLEQWFARHWGPTGAMIAGAILFGLVHCVTPTYAVAAGVMSLYLSWSMSFDHERNLMIPIVAHAAYDYVGFRVLLREARRPGSTDSPAT